MSRPRVRLVLAAGLLVAAIARSVAAQPQATACTNPLDPACNHLKCYQIKDTPITGTGQLLQVDNQFGREAIFRLQPVFLCLPTQKSCCNATGCSPGNCPPNPVPAPGLPHFKCYKIKVKTCSDINCTTLTKFAKGKLVNLRDQFGQELNVSVGNPKLFCAPVEKVVVGQTTTTSTSSTTTTTIRQCGNTAPTGSAPMCSGDCPVATDKCLFNAGVCECVPQTTMCMGTAVPCAGLCPNATDVCAVPPGATACSCFTPCQQSAFPACGGVCPLPMNCIQQPASMTCNCQ